MIKKYKDEGGKREVVVMLILWDNKSNVDKEHCVFSENVEHQ